MNREYEKKITVCNSPKIDIDLSLKIDGKKIVFSACGGVWNKFHTDYNQCGQCLDDIWEEYGRKLIDPTQYKTLLKLWKKWHLNDMHSECIHQEARGETWENNPSIECPECKWKLGHGWSYRAIDKDDLNKIMTLLDIQPLDRLTISKLSSK